MSLNELPAEAMSLIMANLHGDTDAETVRNVARVSQTSRDWRDHIRFGDDTNATPHTMYRDWLGVFENPPPAWLLNLQHPPHLQQGNAANPIVID